MMYILSEIKVEEFNACNMLLISYTISSFYIVYVLWQEIYEDKYIISFYSNAFWLILIFLYNFYQ